MRGGYALDGMVSLDARLDLRRSDYFAAIRDSIGRSYAPGYDATPFVVFFLRAIAGAADHVLARLRGMGEVQIGVRRDVASGNLPRCCLVYAWINRNLRPADYRRVTGRGWPPRAATSRRPRSSATSSATARRAAAATGSVRSCSRPRAAGEPPDPAVPAAR